ncbi:ATP-dependent DNA helicase RecG [Selenomonas sp. TAMA-11512]|uniref:ATP-dependent DNA helicase RecG n=1 Tax=Selenomonas sp. TAMA-11512 TaxID=3095337 RepID=UPI003086063A|nr:ATP-dependent DNA helicase RecG [Selenomonas sp. TAMA-11512]
MTTAKKGLQAPAKKPHAMEESLQNLKGVGSKKYEALTKLHLTTIYSLLTHYPRDYEDRRMVTPISDLVTDDRQSVLGTIIKLEERRTARRMTILTALIGDGTGYLRLTWFNQQFLKDKLTVGTRIYAVGKITPAYGGRGQLAMSPVADYAILSEGEEAETGILPIYPATAKLNQKFFRGLFAQLFEDGVDIPHLIPETIENKYRLLRREEAFHEVHFPEAYASLTLARERLAFEELYLIQCGLLLLRQKYLSERQGVRHLMDGELVQRVQAALPFQLTEDQARAVHEIKRDMEKALPMRRLLQGDVGSGKTVVALLALVKTVENGCQGALLAPTEILARQHYEKFAEILAPTEVRVELLVGGLGKKRREEIYQALSDGEIDLIVGTHALLQEGVRFASLGLVVTDEQHRFGVEQRAALEKKGGEYLRPDLLIMTATPIPRTMTLTVYGDLDVSRIEHLPPGRQAVRTYCRQQASRGKIYDFVESEIAQGRQAYVVCPLIETGEEDETETEREERRLSAAVDVYEELQKGKFRRRRVGLLHGRLPAKEKESVMRAFHRGEIDLLVTTTVVEVGVDVPNASIMVIEDAERFGLAQLHQLRGRIGRGAHRSYCILISESRGDTAKERLTLMETTTDGFKLAEEDLRLRGPGQFFGSMQHGLPDLKMANVLGDMDILLKARQAAQETMGNAALAKEAEKSLSLIYQEFFRRIQAV